MLQRGPGGCFVPLGATAEPASLAGGRAMASTGRRSWHTARPTAMIARSEEFAVHASRSRIHLDVRRLRVSLIAAAIAAAMAAAIAIPASAPAALESARNACPTVDCAR